MLEELNSVMGIMLALIIPIVLISILVLVADFRR
jgi:hypothetical protein